MSDNPAPNARFRMSVTQSRMQIRVDATLERAGGDEQAAITGSGVSISYLLAKEIVASLKIGDAEIERLEAELAGLERQP